MESALSFVEGQQKRWEDKKRKEKEAAEAAARAEEERARASEEKARAEAEETRIQREKTLRFIGRHWKASLAALVVLVLILSLGLWSVASNPAVGNTVAMPESASELKGDNYQDVVTKLQAAGFANIETTTIDDLITGWLTKDGEVERVSVNGETDFSSRSRYPRDARIVIAYHTFPEKEPEEAAESSPAEEETESDEAAESSPAEEFAPEIADDPGEPEPQAAPSGDLAQRTQEAYLAAFGIDSMNELFGLEGVEDSLVPFIVSFEDVGSNTVKVTVQTNNVYEEELDQTAFAILSLTGNKVETLNRVEVWTANGEMYGVSHRWDVPLLNL